MPLIKIDAHGEHLILKHHAVRVYHVEGIVAILLCRYLGDVIVLLVALLHLWVSEQQLGKGAGLIFARFACVIGGYGVCAALLLIQIGQETQLVIGSVAV